MVIVKAKLAQCHDNCAMKQTIGGNKASHVIQLLALTVIEQAMTHNINDTYCSESLVNALPQLRLSKATPNTGEM